MRRDELKALGDLVGDAAAGIATQAREMPRGRLAVGAINGMWGDRLHRDASPLATPMAVRVCGRGVALDARALRSAFPDATPRLAVFVHGLCETEDAWRLHAGRTTPYGDRLRAELGYTPVYVRYNSGRHISHSGRALAAVLEELTAAWPVEVTEVALVPELRPFAAPIRVRSVGVKDLAYGYVVDADWEGHDLDAFWTNTGTVVPFLASANHYFVSASLTRDPEAPVGRYLGDLLVLRSSAWSQGARGERLQFPVDQYAHIGGATHFDLLNHPAVYEQLHTWLSAGAPPLPARV